MEETMECRACGREVTHDGGGCGCCYERAVDESIDVARDNGERSYGSGTGLYALEDSR